jgi:hypothetical protein
MKAECYASELTQYGTTIRSPNCSFRGHSGLTHAQAHTSAGRVGCVLSVLVAATFSLSWLPKHPHSVLGWTVLLVGALPLALLGEYLCNRVILQSRIGARLDALGIGFAASALRITYVLVCVIAVGVLCLAVVAWLNRVSRHAVSQVMAEAA